MSLFKKITHFFDKLEDNLRARLSHRPIFYACVGGVGIVLFWKGIWEAAEQFPQLYGLPSALLGLLLILPTGLFVSFFIGDNIILSGYKREKKLVERTENELRTEIDSIKNMTTRIEHIERTVQHIAAHLEHKPRKSHPQIKRTQQSEVIPTPQPEQLPD